MLLKTNSIKVIILNRITLPRKVLTILMIHTAGLMKSESMIYDYGLL